MRHANAKLTALAETTRDLRQCSEEVQSAAQRLTSALLSPNVKSQREAAFTEYSKKVLSHIDLLRKKDYASKLSCLGQMVD